MGTLISKIEDKTGEKLSFYLVVIFQSIIFIFLALLNTPLVIILLFVFFFFRDYKEALILKYVNERIESSHRATVISIQNFCGRQTLFIKR